MHWEKLKQSHYHAEPVEYIYSSTIYDSLEYDKLYENQNNLNHAVWQEFDKKYKTGFEFNDDIQNIDTKREVIFLWFFKERSDRSGGDEINLAGKIIKYFPNTFFITRSNDIKVIKGKKTYIRRPFLQLDMDVTRYEQIMSRFRT